MMQQEQLVKALTDKRDFLKIDDKELARLLGIDPGLWSKVKNLKKSPGAKFLKGVARAFPDLGMVVFDYIRSGDNGQAA